MGEEISWRRLVDLSHTIEHGTVTLKGFPAPIICDCLSREASRAGRSSTSAAST
jgi:kynurenine formamidase